MNPVTSSVSPSSSISSVSEIFSPATPSSELDEAESYFQSGNAANDPDQAFLWWARAASFNHVEAMFSLGSWYFPKEPECALVWWKVAAERGCHKSMCNLGYVYACRQDFEQAKAWWRKAMSLGDIRSTMLLFAIDPTSIA